MIQSIARSRIHGLLGLHGSLHDGMMSLQGIRVVCVGLEDILFDALAEAVLGNGGDDLGAVVFLGIDPTNHLIHGQQIPTGGSVQVLTLHNSFANGSRVLLDFTHRGWIIENSAVEKRM